LIFTNKVTKNILFFIDGENLPLKNFSITNMTEKGSTFSALKLSLELGYTIAIPIVALALLGRLLDKKFDTSPWILIAGIILSIIISSVALVVKFNTIMRKIQQEDKEEKKEHTLDKEKK